jgi:hypothetical protein
LGLKLAVKLVEFMLMELQALLQQQQQQMWSAAPCQTLQRQPGVSCRT